MSDSSLYEGALSRILAMVPEPPAIPIRPSASVVLWREGDDGRTEVYWVRRSPQLGVLGGWYAFPGGGISSRDAHLPLAGDARTEPGFVTDFPVYDELKLDVDLPVGVVACALRELFEETGLLLVGQGGAITGECCAQGRDRLGRRELKFQELLEEWGASLDASRLTFAGRWVTPPVSPIRFDTRFFLLEWPADEAVQPTVDGGELVEGTWVAAEEALDRWRRGEALAAPPTLYVLEVLANQGPTAGLARLVEHGRETRHANQRFLELRPGIIPLPMITPTLPPARETMSYVLGGTDVVLVDVGSPFAGEVDRLVEMMRFLDERWGKKLRAIWLTHHHPDHVWGVSRFREAIGVPIFAHKVTADRVRSMGIEVDGELHDGQVVTLAGDPPVRIEVLHTPGHAKGHLAFWEPAHRSLIAGDLVAGQSTIVIDPPDGNMEEYLTSLRRVRSLEPRILFPSHGPAIQDACQRLDLLIAHRLHREEQIATLWKSGVRDLGDLVARAYTDVSVDLHPFAARQAIAHLERLSGLGHIEGFSK